MQTDIKNEFLMNHAYISYTLVRIVWYKDDQCITMANVSIHFLITQPTVSQTRPPEEKPRPEAGPMKQNLQAGCQLNGSSSKFTCRKRSQDIHLNHVLAFYN